MLQYKDILDKQVTIKKEIGAGHNMSKAEKNFNKGDLKGF